MAGSAPRSVTRPGQEIVPAMERGVIEGGK